MPKHDLTTAGIYSLVGLVPVDRIVKVETRIGLVEAHTSHLRARLLRRLQRLASARREVARG
jgi:hypothetical protein